jgi:hypothetical protein
MCLGDYHYLLNKLRIVTYGNDYKMTAVCPLCGNLNNDSLDLESLKMLQFDESLTDNLEITLPVTGKIVKLKLQTPRAIDDIQIRKNDILKDMPNMDTDPTILFTLISIVDKIDGQVYDRVKLESWIRALPMRDVNKMLNSVKKLNDRIGYDLTLKLKCKSCGLDYTSTFRINNEFFGPTDDE